MFQIWGLRGEKAIQLGRSLWGDEMGLYNFHSKLGENMKPNRKATVKYKLSLINTLSLFRSRMLVKTSKW